MKTTFNSILIFKYISFLFSFCFLFSCAKDSQLDINGKGSVLINVSSVLANTEYEENIINRKSASAILLEPLNEPSISTISLNEDYYLQISISSSNPKKVASSKIKNNNSINNSALNKAASSPLTPGIIYRLLVYNASNGNYITQRQYTSGSEDDNLDVLKLDGGVTYTFVAYSVNTIGDASVLPPGPQDNLSTASINLSSSRQFLFFKKNLTITGEAVDYLNIIFKPQFTEINVNINAEATGYLIETIGARLNVETSDFSFSFQSESITNIGANVFTETTLSFPTLLEEQVTSSSVFIKPQSVSSLFTLTSLKIGPLTKTFSPGYTPSLSGGNLLPGKKYTIALTINPEDSTYTDDDDVPVVLIGGQVWMRSNLGATTTTPNIIDINSYGNYYQWGTTFITSDRNATLVTSPPTGWNNDINNVSGNNYWNLGTETNPIKNPAYDPCPPNFRVPTALEYQNLMNNTVYSEVGTPNVGNGYGAIFTSKRNASVKLTFPAQGWFSVGKGINDQYHSFVRVSDYAFAGLYWTSNRIAIEDITIFNFDDDGPPFLAPAADDGEALASIPIRCISTAKD